MHVENKKEDSESMSIFIFVFTEDQISKYQVVLQLTFHTIAFAHLLGRPGFPLFIFIPCQPTEGLHKEICF